MVAKRGGADVIRAQIDGNTAFLAHFGRGYPLNTPVLFFIGAIHFTALLKPNRPLRSRRKERKDGTAKGSQNRSLSGHQARISRVFVMFCRKAGIFFESSVPIRKKSILLASLAP